MSLSSIKLELDGELDGDDATTAGCILGESNGGGTHDQGKCQLYMVRLQRLLDKIRETCGFHNRRQDAVRHKTNAVHL